MPSASTSILRRPSASRSSLSHSMVVRSSIAAFMIGRDLVEPVAGDDEAAAVLGEMARKAGEFARHRQRQRQRRIGRVEAGCAHARLADRRRPVAPGRAVQRRDHVVGEAEHFRRLADRRAGAVGDDRRGEAGALAPVALVDVLDHLLAPLVLEIDVDVGRLVALGRDEALEQEIEARRVDLGDPEAEADGGIGRRAAALAEDSARAGEAHDVVHGEEIGRVVERGDEGELVGRAPRARARGRRRDSAPARPRSAKASSAACGVA